MCRLCGLFLTGFLITLFGFFANAQTGSGTISGKVMIGERPAKGVTVSVRLGDNRTYPPKPSIASTVTDGDGKYWLTGLAAGNYLVAPYQPADIIPGSIPWERGSKTVNLSEGENTDNIDFQMSPGGVITGRILGPDGRPMIEQTVQVNDAVQERNTLISGSSEMYRTDDRGIYRVYGLPPGKYRVSVGEEKNGDSITVGITSSSYIPRTYFPGVPTKAEATIVNLSEGDELNGIDIAVGSREKTYAISGRTIDQATGKPAPDVPLGYGTISSDGGSMRSLGFSNSMRSDANGEFRLEGIRPGKYAILPSSMQNSDDGRIGKPVPVEVVENDVEGVEVSVSQGASLSGTAVVEGVFDPAILAKLNGLNIAIISQNTPGQLSAQNYRSTKIAGDGSFIFQGLAPGKLSILFGSGLQTSPTGLSLVRVEQNGQLQPENRVEVIQGSDNANVKLVFQYATGIIRGQTAFVNGTLPSGAMLYASARGTSEPGRNHGATVDARGHFVIEGLNSGNYVVTVSVVPSQGAGAGAGRGFNGHQNVSVTNGSESQTIVTIDLNPPRPQEVNREE